MRPESTRIWGLKLLVYAGVWKALVLFMWGYWRYFASCCTGIVFKHVHPLPHTHTTVNTHQLCTHTHTHMTNTTHDKHYTHDTHTGLWGFSSASRCVLEYANCTWSKETRWKASCEGITWIAIGAASGTSTLISQIPFGFFTAIKLSAMELYTR